MEIGKRGKKKKSKEGKKNGRKRSKEKRKRKKDVNAVEMEGIPLRTSTFASAYPRVQA